MKLKSECTINEEEKNNSLHLYTQQLSCVSHELATNNIELGIMNAL